MPSITASVSSTSFAGDGGSNTLDIKANLGTREFDDVFAIAARVYPENEVVNINAANAAMSLGNMRSAEKYLQRLGESPVAAYTKGVCCALEEDWEGAVMFFTLAQASGVKEATGALKTAKEMLEYLQLTQ